MQLKEKETSMNQDKYLDVSQENGKALYMRHLEGKVIMLNLLKFRNKADYSSSPELEPETPISGKEAYDLYMKYTLPQLRESEGEVLFFGQGGQYLIGPSDVQWDVAMLVKHKSVGAFMAFAKNEGYLKGIGHRQAALQDSRLLALTAN